MGQQVWWGFEVLPLERETQRDFSFWYEVGWQWLERYSQTGWCTDGTGLVTQRINVVRVMPALKTQGI